MKAVNSTAREELQISIEGDQLRIFRGGLVVVVDFSGFNPDDKPVGGIMIASGVKVAIGPL